MNPYGRIVAAEEVVVSQIGCVDCLMEVKEEAARVKDQIHQEVGSISEIPYHVTNPGAVNHHPNLKRDEVPTSEQSAINNHGLTCITH